MRDKLNQIACGHSRKLERLSFGAVCTIILIVLLIPVGCSKQRGGGGDTGNREPGALVSFGVDLAGVSFGSREHADVTIGGKLICSVQNMNTAEVFLPEGEYQIRVSADGFEAIERDISVKNSPTQSFHFELQRKQ